MAPRDILFAKGDLRSLVMRICVLWFWSAVVCPEHKIQRRLCAWSWTFRCDNYTYDEMEVLHLSRVPKWTCSCSRVHDDVLQHTIDQSNSQLGGSARCP